jgi:hypothetical protein
MNIKPKRWLKKVTVFVGAIALLLGLLVVYDAIWRKLYPPKPVVLDLCDPADKTFSAQTTQQCRWVIPGKYISKSHLSDDLIQARVPWLDIDPTYQGDPKNTVTFQFSPGHSRYADGIRRKKEIVGASKPDEYGLLWLRSKQQIYFEGFDGIEVYVFSVPSFSSPLPHARIFRPLPPKGDMHWIVPFPPKLESQTAMDSYVQQNIREIDRKLMQFISQWH